MVQGGEPTKPQPSKQWGPEIRSTFRIPGPDDRRAFDHLQTRGYLQAGGTLEPPLPPGSESAPGPGPETLWDPATETRRALFVDGVPKAGLYLNRFTVRWGDRDLRMDGIGGVVALPEARRQGHTEAVLAGSLADMRERAVWLSFITTPFSYRFYRKMGWGYAFRRTLYTFPLTQAQAFAKRATGEARFVRVAEASLTAGEVPEPLDTVYRTALFPRYHGLAVRTARLWRERLTGERTYAYIWEGPSGPSGYAILAPREDELRVREFVWADRDALFGLLGLMGNFDSQARRIRVETAPDVRLDALLPEQGEVSASAETRGMLRLVDVPSAFEARDFAGIREPLTVRLNLTDALAPWNQGAWDLRAEAGRVIVTPARGSPGLPAARLDIAVLSSLYAGDLTAGEAATLGLGEMDPGALDALNRLFAGSTRPLHLEWY